MTNNDNFNINPDSGISEEEQREILEKINGITENRRRSLSAGEGNGDGKKSRFKAKKSGKRLPFLVNAAAVTALIVGIVILLLTTGKLFPIASAGLYNTSSSNLFAGFE